MDTPTYETPPEPDYTPRPNPIFETSSTPAVCAEDYANAAAVRAELDKQQRT